MRFSFDPKSCAVCGKEFTPRSGRAKYCSDGCKPPKPKKPSLPPSPPRPPDLADVKCAKILSQIYSEYQETLTERVADIETRLEVLEYDHRRTIPGVAKLGLDE